jgi:translation initiation factor 3 subunit F
LYVNTEGTWPHPAVHLTVSTQPGRPIDLQTYISGPIGVTEERFQDSCAFIPVPHEVKYTDADRSGLELIASAKDKENRSAPVEMDLDTLERSLLNILDLLERVSVYVSNVLDEEAPPSTALGQFLINALSLAPKVDPANIERDM